MGINWNLEFRIVERRRKRPNFLPVEIEIRTGGKREFSRNWKRSFSYYFYIFCVFSSCLPPVFSVPIPNTNRLVDPT
jgi:hypothetical protein